MSNVEPLAVADGGHEARSLRPLTGVTPTAMGNRTPLGRRDAYLITALQTTQPVDRATPKTFHEVSVPCSQERDCQVSIYAGFV